MTAVPGPPDPSGPARRPLRRDCGGDRRLHRAGSGIVVLCATVGFGASAQGAATTTVLTSRSAEVQPTTLSYGPSGEALATWQGWSGSSPDTLSPFHALAFVDREGARAPVTLPLTVIAHDATLSGSATIGLATWRQEPVGKRYSRSRIVVALVDPATHAARTFLSLDRGRPLPLSAEGPTATLTSPRIAATPHGGVAVAWLRGEPRSRAGIWLTSVGANGSLGARRRVGPFGSDPVLKVAADGSGILAWRRGRRVLARLRRPGGRWGPAETVATLATAVGHQVESMTASGSGRRFVIGIAETRRSMSGVDVRLSVHARVTGRWSSGTLSAFRFVPTGATSFVTDRLRVLTLRTSGGALRAVWPTLEAGHVVAMTARLVPERSSVGFSAPERISTPGVDVALDDAAPGPAGSVAVSWFSAVGGQGTPNLSERQASGATTVTRDLAGEQALIGSLVAYDPRSSRPTVVWSEGTAPAGYRLVAWTAP